MQALALMKTLGSAPMRDDLCAECMHAHRSAPLATLTSVRWYLAGDAAPGGRTTKASQPRRAIRGNLHKHADNVLLTRGGKRLGNAEEWPRLEQGGKYGYGRGKAP